MSNIISTEISDIVSDIKLDPIPKNKPLSSWMFNLEGAFLGFLGDNPRQVKSIVIEVEQEQLTIKLPKKLRASVQQSVKQRFLKPGDRLRCIGRSRLDFAMGVVELKAYCLFLEANNKEINPEKSFRKQSINTDIDKIEKRTAVYSEKPKPAKILVCHKAGCKKRGGRQLITALKQTLESYELQNQVEIQYTGCQKRCSKAPSFTVIPGNHHYDRLTLSSLSAIVEKHFC